MNKGIEKKLGDIQIIAEQVPALEMEKKRLHDKDVVSVETMTKLRKDIEKLKEDVKKAKEEAEEAKQNATPDKKSRASKAGASGKANIIEKIMRQSTAKKEAQPATGNPSGYFPVNSNRGNPMTGGGTLSDEFVSSVIAELQRDRMELKMKDARIRFNKLAQEDGAFNSYIKNMKKHREQKLKITQDESKAVQNAVTTVIESKKRIKKQLAEVRVVDLTKSSRALPSTEKAWQTMQTAKDQLTTVSDILLNKDGYRPATNVAKAEKKPEQTNVVELGCLKLIKPVNLGKNRERLVMNENTLKMFKSQIQMLQVA